MLILKEMEDLLSENVPDSIKEFYREIGFLEHTGKHGSKKYKIAEPYSPVHTLLANAGGDVYVVQSMEDMQHYKITSLKDINGEPLSKLTADHVFDVAEWLKGNRYALFHTVTNDAGGEAFFIPAKLVGTTLRKAMHHTKLYWEKNQETV